MAKSKAERRKKPGPEAERLKLKGDWAGAGGQGAGEEAPEEGMAETMTRAAGLVLVLALLGCAKDWKHPTKTQDQYYKDVYDCQRETTEPRLPKVEADRLFDSCMRARGWRD